MEASSLTNPQPFDFLGLPPEIRFQIYMQLLRRPSPITDITPRPPRATLLPCPQPPSSLSILLVSRAITNEALAVLYGANTFQLFLYDDGGAVLYRLSAANRARIRRLQLLMRPRGRFYGAGGTLDAALWAPLLGNAARVLIVAQQPEGWLDERTMRNQMQAWSWWVMAVLDFVAGQLRGACRVEVDCGGREETGALMRVCLSGGYREVRTEIGDYFFLRGKFAH